MQKWLFLVSLVASPAFAQQATPAGVDQALQTTLMAALQRSQDLDRVVPAPLRAAPPPAPEDPDMLALGGNLYVDRALLPPRAEDRKVRVYRREVR